MKGLQAEHWISPNPNYGRKKAHLLNKEDRLLTLCSLRTFIDDNLETKDRHIDYYEDKGYYCQMCVRIYKERIEKELSDEN